MTESDLIVHLTAGVIVMNCVTAVRALSVAQALESGCVWVCQSIGHRCVMRVLLGIATICFMLAVLKAWFVFGVVHANEEKHYLKAFAYLAENYGVAMIGYAVVSMIKRMTQCDTAGKIKKGKAKLVKT